LSNQLNQYMSNYGYLPPERLGKYDEIITEMSDIWMFGVLVYELLTNQLPFGSTKDGLANDTIMLNILGGQIIGDTSYLIPPYKDIVEKCLENDPSQRFQQVSEILAFFPTQPQSQSLSEEEAQVNKQKPEITSQADTQESPSYSSFETTRGFGDTVDDSINPVSDKNEEDYIYGTKDYEPVVIGEPQYVPSEEEAAQKPSTKIKDKSLLDTLDETTSFDEQKEKRVNRLLWIVLILSTTLALFAIYFLIKYDSTKAQIDRSHYQTKTLAEFNSAKIFV